MNGIMNNITNSNEEYQEIVRKADEYSGRLERIGLPMDIRLLIDSYINEQNRGKSLRLSRSSVVLLIKLCFHSKAIRLLAKQRQNALVRLICLCQNIVKGTS